jgi:hypothetical protein
MGRVLALLLVLAGGAWMDARAAEALGVAANLAFETGTFMKETVHAEHRTPPTNWAARSGAIAMNTVWETNKDSKWYIEYQKVGWDYVSAGLAFGEKDTVSWGLKIFEWGFDQMAPDGEFRHPDCYHSASFLVEAAAHAVLLLEASPMRGEFAARVDALKPKLHAAARWMIRPDIDALNWPDDDQYPRIYGERRYAHRRFLDAAALGMAGMVCRDAALGKRAAELARDGIAFQWPDGVNPERGGHDTSYQAFGLIYACRYYQVAADETVRAEMKPMLERAYAWYLTRVGPDGEVDGTGNTRTGPDGEPGRNGSTKQLDYRSGAVCLAHWAQITGRRKHEALARKLWAMDRKIPRTGSGW